MAEQSDSEGEWINQDDNDDASPEETENEREDDEAIENGFQLGNEPEAIPILPPAIAVHRARVNVAAHLRERFADRGRGALVGRESSSSSSSSDGESSEHEPQHINVKDAINHEYLFTRRTRRREGQVGEVLDLAMPSETIVAEMIMELPMLRISQDCFPMPNQRIPLLLYHPNDMATAKFAVAHHSYLAAFPGETFGYDPRVSTPIDVGVLLQIARSCDGGQRGFRVYAIGRNRIKLLETIRNIDSSLSARVQILAENLLPPLQFSLVPNKARSQVKVQQRKIAEKLYNIPRWVISRFSTEKKARTLLNFMCSWSPSPETKVKLEETYNKGLTELSFFLAANIPVEIDTKLALLQENSVDRRIDMMVEKLFKKMDIACVRCHTTIARAEDIFSVTAEGNSRHFVNNYGFVHEIITATEAQHYAFRGPPDASFSWFEGYKWQIIECTMCLDHLGWEYTSKKYEPKSFFGLTRRSVALRERKDDQPISTEEQLSLVPDDVSN